MTWKEFVIGLIENEIERDLTQRAAMSDKTLDINATMCYNKNMR